MIRRTTFPPAIRRIAAPHAVAAVGCAVATLVAAPNARADCAPFATAGSGATLTGDARCVPATGALGDEIRAGDNFAGQTGSVAITGGASVTLDAGGDLTSDDRGPFVVIGRISDAVAFLYGVRSGRHGGPSLRRPCRGQDEL